jgi:hypothetical protein
MRTKGQLVGSMVRHSWSHTSLGYLPPESMAFLLAAQAVVRRATWTERRRLASLLEPNQAASFRIAWVLTRGLADANYPFHECSRRAG